MIRLDRRGFTGRRSIRRPTGPVPAARPASARAGVVGRGAEGTAASIGAAATGFGGAGGARLLAQAAAATGVAAASACGNRRRRRRSVRARAPHHPAAPAHGFSRSGHARSAHPCRRSRTRACAPARRARSAPGRRRDRRGRRLPLSICMNRVSSSWDRSPIGRQARHARATLEGVQRALERRAGHRRCCDSRSTAPAHLARRR